MKLPKEFEAEDYDDDLYDVICVILDIMYALIVTVIVLVGAFILISDIQQYDVNHGVHNEVIIIEKE